MYQVSVYKFIMILWMLGLLLGLESKQLNISYFKLLNLNIKLVQFNRVSYILI